MAARIPTTVNALHAEITNEVARGINQANQSYNLNRIDENTRSQIVQSLMDYAAHFRLISKKYHKEIYPWFTYGPDGRQKYINKPIGFGTAGTSTEEYEAFRKDIVKDISKARGILNIERSNRLEQLIKAYEKAALKGNLGVSPNQFRNVLDEFLKNQDKLEKIENLDPNQIGSPIRTSAPSPRGTGTPSPKGTGTPSPIPSSPHSEASLTPRGSKKIRDWDVESLTDIEDQDDRGDRKGFADSKRKFPSDGKYGDDDAASKIQKSIDDLSRRISDLERAFYRQLEFYHKGLGIIDFFALQRDIEQLKRELEQLIKRATVNMPGREWGSLSPRFAGKITELQMLLLSLSEQLTQQQSALATIEDQIKSDRSRRPTGRSGISRPPVAPPSAIPAAAAAVDRKRDDDRKRSRDRDEGSARRREQISDRPWSYSDLDEFMQLLILEQKHGDRLLAKFRTRLNQYLDKWPLSPDEEKPEFMELIKYISTLIGARNMINDDDIRKLNEYLARVDSAARGRGRQGSPQQPSQVGPSPQGAPQAAPIAQPSAAVAQQFPSAPAQQPPAGPGVIAPQQQPVVAPGAAPQPQFNIQFPPTWTPYGYAYAPSAAAAFMQPQGVPIPNVGLPAGLTRTQSMPDAAPGSFGTIPAASGSQYPQFPQHPWGIPAPIVQAIPIAAAPTGAVDSKRAGDSSRSEFFSQNQEIERLNEKLKRRGDKLTISDQRIAALEAELRSRDSNYQISQSSLQERMQTQISQFSSERNEYQSQINDLKRGIEILTSRLETANHELLNSRSQAQESASRLRALEDAKSNAERSAGDLKNQHDHDGRRIEDLQKDHERERASWKERIAQLERQKDKYRVERNQSRSEFAILQRDNWKLQTQVSQPSGERGDSKYSTETVRLRAENEALQNTILELRTNLTNKTTEIERIIRESADPSALREANTRADRAERERQEEHNRYVEENRKFLDQTRVLDDLRAHAARLQEEKLRLESMISRMQLETNTDHQTILELKETIEQERGRIEQLDRERNDLLNQINRYRNEIIPGLENDLVAARRETDALKNEAQLRLLGLEGELKRAMDQIAQRDAERKAALDAQRALEADLRQARERLAAETQRLNTDVTDLRLRLQASETLSAQRLNILNTHHVTPKFR